MTPTNRTGSPHAFILAYRRMAAVPNVKKTTALALAQEANKEDYAAYRKALSEGVALEPLDRAPDFAKRLARAAALGGRIN